MPKLLSRFFYKAIRGQKHAKSGYLFQHTTMNCWPWNWSSTTQSGVWSFMVIIFQKFMYDISQLSFGTKNQIIEAFGLKGFDEGFCVSILLWASWLNKLRFYSCGTQNLGKTATEQWIAVVNHIFVFFQLSVKTVNLIAGNLSHVVSIRIMDDGSAPGNTSVNIDKKQNKVSDKSPSLGYDLIGTEIAGDGNIAMRIKKQLEIKDTFVWLLRIQTIIRHHPLYC